MALGLPVANMTCMFKTLQLLIAQSIVPSRDDPPYDRSCRLPIIILTRVKASPSSSAVHAGTVEAESVDAERWLHISRSQYPARAKTTAHRLWSSCDPGA